MAYAPWLIAVDKSIRRHAGHFCYKKCISITNMSGCYMFCFVTYICLSRHVGLHNKLCDMSGYVRTCQIVSGQCPFGEH